MASSGEEGANGQAEHAEEQGTPCRLVGRFAPIVGAFTATRDEVAFHSNPHLSRQIAVKIVIPTRAIKDSRLDSDGRVLQVGVQGMAGRSLSFEYNNAIDCSEAAMALAQAGQESEDILQEESSEDPDVNGCVSAVLDEAVLRHRYRFTMDEGNRLLAWERCTRKEMSETPSVALGVIYVCEGVIIFLPDRYCRGGSERSLRAASTVLLARDVLSVKQVFGGLEMEGVCLGAGKQKAVTVRFELGLAQDWEALAHAVHALVAEGQAGTFGGRRDEQEGDAEADERDREWRKKFAGKAGIELRGEAEVRETVWGSETSFIPLSKQGIPRGSREMMWLKLSGAEDLKGKHPAGYARQMLYPPQEQGHDPGMAKAEFEIDKDVKRTFVDSEIRDTLAAVGRGRDSNTDWFCPKLKRLLLAYARHNRRVGYCQSLNYLGGIVVIVVEREEDCFWLLVAILDNLLPKTYYGDLSGVMLDVEVLNLLMERSLKPVKDKLEITHLPLTSFAAQWLMCAFVNVLSGPSVLRVWDCLFVDGHVVLFRVALALLKAIEGELGLATEMEEAMQALQRAKTLEIQTVLQIANGCFGEGVVDLSLLMQLRHQAIRSVPRN